MRWMRCGKLRILLLMPNSTYIYRQCNSGCKVFVHNSSPMWTKSKTESNREKLMNKIPKMMIKKERYTVWYFISSLKYFFTYTFFVCSCPDPMNHRIVNVEQIKLFMPKAIIILIFFSSVAYHPLRIMAMRKIPHIQTHTYRHVYVYKGHITICWDAINISTQHTAVVKPEKCV